MLATWITLLSVAFGAFAGPLTHRALSTGFVNLSFALEPKNSSLLHKTVLGISLPESENYGKHLSRKEAKALLEPSQETTQLIKTFLQDTGAQFIETDGQWIHATIKAAAWQQLSKRNGLPEHAGLDLPEHVAKHIRLVHRQSSCNKDDPAQPTLLNAPIKSSKSLLETRRSDKTNITQCASIMTPACLHWLYHMEPNHEATSHHRSLLGIAGFDQVRLSVISFPSFYFRILTSYSKQPNTRSSHSFSRPMLLMQLAPISRALWSTVEPTYKTSHN